MRWTLCIAGAIVAWAVLSIEGLITGVLVSSITDWGFYAVLLAPVCVAALVGEALLGKRVTSKALVFGAGIIVAAFAVNLTLTKLSVPAMTVWQSFVLVARLIGAAMFALGVARFAESRSVVA